MSASSSSNKNSFSRGNHICGDCGASDAQWASLNRGVLICEECCSVHRVLGRHVTQVKSLRKSPWAPSQLAMVISLYGKGANSLWEHSLMHPSSGTKLTKRKPSPRDPVHPNKSEFIRAKYQLQSFIHRPSKDEPQCSANDLSQQLHSCVRTGNVEISLRLLCLGADPDYWHCEKGNRPLHVAAKAGQWSQVELLIVYGADPGAPDISGETPAEHARRAGLLDMADRLTECQYQLTDRLAYFLCHRKPDHSAGQHFLIPEMGDKSLDLSEYLKSAKKKIHHLNNHLFETLSMDVYDEVDRREIDAICQSAQQGVGTLQQQTPDRHITAFLPVNPNLSAMHNQARQKLARLHAREFATLIIDVLAEVRRRQLGVEQTRRNLCEINLQHESALIEQIPQLPNESEASEPLYDVVATEDDYVDARDRSVFGGTGRGRGRGDVNMVASCSTDSSGALEKEPDSSGVTLVTAEQYTDMKKALRDAIEREKSLTITVTAMKDDLNRLHKQVNMLLEEKTPLKKGGAWLVSGQNGGLLAEAESDRDDGRVVFAVAEPTFSKSLRDLDSGIQEGPDETSLSDNIISRQSTDMRDCFPAPKLIEGRTSLITAAIGELKKAAESGDTHSFSSSAERIQACIGELVQLFLPLQALLPEEFAVTLASLTCSADRLECDCRVYLTVAKDEFSSLQQCTQCVIDDAYNVAMSLKQLLILYSKYSISSRQP